MLPIFAVLLAVTSTQAVTDAATRLIGAPTEVQGRKDRATEVMTAEATTKRQRLQTAAKARQI